MSDLSELKARLGELYGHPGACLCGACELKRRTLAAIEALESRVAELEAALLDMIAVASGNPKSCGHEHYCDCAFRAAQAAIATPDREAR